MKYENLKIVSGALFRRLTGVKRKKFKLMVRLLTEALAAKKARGGRPNKLSIANMLLMALEYLREYRTYASIAISYGVSESTAYTIITWVETVLVNSKEFRLPGKKALLKSDMELQVILVDATETPIERPKKNKSYTIQEKRSGTL